ncbi:MAG: hypothetical protein V3V16_04160 [Melioribacteraceae bacterium]
MKTSIVNLKLSKTILVTLTIFMFVFIASCGSNRLQIAEFDFVHNGNGYVLRSAYCPNNPKSCNYLIGNGFVAVDMNQDRIMDKITKGNIALSEAQQIYDYCLNQLEKTGKLNEIDNKSIEFILKESDYTLKIKSLSKDDKPFNQFTIVDVKLGIREAKISIFNDTNADGILNEFLKGNILIGDAQQMYNRTVEKGLKQGKLYKINESIIVK